MREMMAEDPEGRAKLSKEDARHQRHFQRSVQREVEKHPDLKADQERLERHIDLVRRRGQATSSVDSMPNKEGQYQPIQLPGTRTPSGYPGDAPPEMLDNALSRAIDVGPERELIVHDPPAKSPRIAERPLEITQGEWTAVGMPGTPIRSEDNDDDNGREAEDSEGARGNTRTEHYQLTPTNATRGGKRETDVEIGVGQDDAEQEWKRWRMCRPGGVKRPQELDVEDLPEGESSPKRRPIRDESMDGGEIDKVDVMEVYSPPRVVPWSPVGVARGKV